MTPRTGRPPKSEYLTTTQAAEYLTERGYRRSGRSVARLCDTGRLACIKPGREHRDRRIHPDALDDFLATRLDSK